MQIVSLTTDFGLSDYFVAALKASILSQAGEVQFIDVSHEIPQHDIMQAAYFLNNVHRSFPIGTIHILAVYNYYAPDSHFVLYARDQHYYIAPNNGVLSLLFDDIDPSEVRNIDFGEGLRHTSILANAVALIANGLELEEIGPITSNLSTKLPIRPVITKSQIRATIMHIDHFENAVINISQEQFEQVRNGRRFEIYYKQTEPINKISKHFAEVPIGDVLAMFDSSGYLVIAMNMQKASSMLNLVKNETIQINFY